MATNTNQKNKTESYVRINIDKMRKTVGYAATMKALYRTHSLELDCVYIVFPSGNEMRGRGRMSPDEFDKMVDHLAEQCKDSTDEDWEV